MPFTDSFWRALHTYAILFPDAASLGTGTPPAVWWAEYQVVRKEAEASVLVNATTGPDGGMVSGQKNFDPQTKEDALNARRHELDPTFPLPIHLTHFAAEKAARISSGRRGFTLRFGA